jgi:hypothetical protein
MRRFLPLAAGIALGLAAVLLGALAVQVWRYSDHVARQDELLRLRPVPSGAWAKPGGVTADVLGAADDETLRRAIALYLRGRPDEAGATKTGEQVVSSLESAIVLAGLMRGDPPLARRALAANLAGILIGEDAVFEPEGAPRVQRAAEQFRQSIHVRPDSVAAKANLELLFNYAGPSGIEAESTGGFGGFGKEGGAGEAGGGY